MARSSRAVGRAAGGTGGEGGGAWGSTTASMAVLSGAGGGRGGGRAGEVIPLAAPVVRAAALLKRQPAQQGERQVDAVELHAGVADAQGALAQAGEQGRPVE